MTSGVAVRGKLGAGEARMARSVGFRWFIQAIMATVAQEDWTIADLQECLDAIRDKTRRGGVWARVDCAIAARRYLQRRLRQLRQTA